MANSSAQGNGQAGGGGTAPEESRVRRDILPIPDVQHIGLTTFDAKIPTPATHRSGTYVHQKVRPTLSSF